MPRLRSWSSGRNNPSDFLDRDIAGLPWQNRQRQSGVYGTDMAHTTPPPLEMPKRSQAPQDSAGTSQSDQEGAAELAEAQAPRWERAYGRLKQFRDARGQPLINDTDLYIARGILSGGMRQLNQWFQQIPPQALATHLEHFPAEMLQLGLAMPPLLHR